MESIHNDDPPGKGIIYSAPTIEQSALSVSQEIRVLTVIQNSKTGCILSEEQTLFRPTRCAIEHIFNVRVLIGKHMRRNKYDMEECGKYT